MSTPESFSFPAWFIKGLRRLAKRRRETKSHIAFKLIGAELCQEFPELKPKYEYEIQRREGDET